MSEHSGEILMPETPKAPSPSVGPSVPPSVRFPETESVVTAKVSPAVRASDPVSAMARLLKTKALLDRVYTDTMVALGARPDMLVISTETLYDALGFVPPEVSLPEPLPDREWTDDGSA